MSRPKRPRKRAKPKKHYTYRDPAEQARLDVHYQLSWAIGRSQFKGLR